MPGLNDLIATLDQQYDGVRDVEQVLEQQYGVRMLEDEHGRTLVQLRIDGMWSEPIDVELLVGALD